MKVFLSWSGARSHAVAEALKDWLPDVINAVEPWLSSDIEKGAASMQEIATSLQGCTFGIICVTPENQNTPWINYEAGAISKTVDDAQARVATLLIDIERPAQVTGPLAQFQATKLELDDFIKLILSLDKATETPREPARVEKLVKQLWPSLEERLNEAKAISTPDHPADKRSTDEKLDELLELTRQVVRSNATNPSALAPGLTYDDIQRLFIEREARRHGDISDWRENVYDKINLQQRVLTVTDRHVGKKETRGIKVINEGSDLILVMPNPITAQQASEITTDVEELVGIRPSIVMPRPREDQA